MNPRIERDVRLVLPPWLLAIVLVTVAALLPRSFGQGWIITVVVFAWPIIAASILGGEFGHNTISQLLTQPLDRRHIWREKMIVLGIALASLFLAVMILESEQFDKSATLFLAIVPICAFCTIPFYTLVGRGTLAAVILALPIPGIIFVVGAGIILWLFHIGALEPTDPYSPINEDRLHWWVRGYFGIVLPAYCALLYYLGYRRFLTFEVVGRGQRQIRLPASMQSGLERLAKWLIPSRLRHLRALVGKELHLQHSATSLFFAFTILQILAFIYIKLAHPKEPADYFTIPLFIYAAIMPLVIGSSAIAEETNLGTRAWHLTLPYSARAQWFVKFAVVMLLTAVFAIGIPLFWVHVGHNFIHPGESWPDAPADALFCAPVLLLAMIAFYASSFSRDTLRALLTTVGLCAGLILSVSVVGAAIEHSQLASGAPLLPLLQRFSTPGIIHVLTSSWLIAGMPLLCFVALLAHSSLTHFTTLDGSPILPRVLLVCLCPVFLLFLLASLGMAAHKLR